MSTKTILAFFIYKTNNDECFYINKKGQHIQFDQFIPCDDLKVYTWSGAKRVNTQMWHKRNDLAITSYIAFSCADARYKVENENFYKIPRYGFA